MLTPFGKFCRKLRIDRGEKQKFMAEKLEVTSSYLSSVENGKRNIPPTWSDKLIELYELDSEQADVLNETLLESQKALTIDFEEYSLEEKSILLDLAKRLKSLDSSDKEKINEILNNNMDSNTPSERMID